MGIPESNKMQFGLMHLQIEVGAFPHLCMDGRNLPTAVQRRLSRTQASLGRPIPGGLALGLGTKKQSSD